MFKSFFILILASFSLHSFSQQIIPVPVYLKPYAGFFLLDKNVSVSFNSNNKDLQSAVTFFSAAVNSVSGIQLKQQTSATKKIEFIITSIPDIGTEGYLLNVNRESINVKANTKAGIIYAMQTILQTLPAIQNNAPFQVPCMEIKDYPRFEWRGMHLDVSRHFFGPEVVKEYINLMASYKMNIFHWHLIDDQGWRIEIKKYPLLTQVGAWRADKTNISWRERPQANANDKADYGGFYTQEQIKEIIQYAKERNVTIIPEIEMPGHVASAIASYPALSCNQQFQLPLTGGIYTNISSNYCAGNDSVFLFLENVLIEVINLFPSQYIHVGGDEVNKAPWKACARCQKRIKAEGLKDEDELQSYFMKRIEKFIVSKKRKMIGWDEILEGGLAPEAAVMSWRGEAGGIEAAKMSHNVVMTPGSPCYFDHYQAGPEGEPIAIGGMNTLKKVYDYEPIPKELDALQSKFVMGAQANLWTEFVTSAEQVEYMVLPRMLALAEVVWSPKSTRDWQGFSERLKLQFKIFDQKGLHYSKGNFKVDIKPFVENGFVNVSLFTEANNAEIRYTTDGSIPNTSSTKYEKPIVVDRSLNVKAITYVEGQQMTSIPSEQSFSLHKAMGKEVKYATPNSKSYPANGTNTLTDGIRGTIVHGKSWHAFNGKDMIATIDLLSEMSIHKISMGAIQNYRSWIFLPQWVKFEISLDGKIFTEIKTVSNTIPAIEQTMQMKDFVTDFPSQQARYIRVTAKSLETVPKGHPGEGKPAWLFADEIVVE